MVVRGLSSVGEKYAAFEYINCLSVVSLSIYQLVQLLDRYFCGLVSTTKLINVQFWKKTGLLSAFCFGPNKLRKNK